MTSGDTRPFPAVLAEWLARRGLSAYAASAAHGGPLSASPDTIRNWLSGRPCPYEREVRALMAIS